MLEEIPWDLFYILLAVALDLDERDSYNRYLLAQGDPKKWPWSSPDKAGTLRGRTGFWSRVAARMGRGRKGKLKDIAGHLGIPEAIAIYRRNPDGSRGEFIRYANPETGETVDMTGRVFKAEKKSQDGRS